MLKRIQVVLIIFVMVSFVSTAIAFLHLDEYTIAFVQVGQGDSCLITTPGGRRILIDSGISKDTADKTPIAKYCSTNAISKIDVAFVSHYHEDHVGGMIKLFETVPCEMMLLPKPITKQDIEYKDRLITNAKGAKAYYFQPHERLDLGDDLKIQALYYDSTPQASVNDNSMVMRVHCMQTDILFTGDIGFEAEWNIIKSLPAELLKCDIIKVAHHGSKYSSSDQFYGVVKPKEAVICVGKNTFGHPSSDAMNRITNAGTKIYRTDQGGTVKITVDKEGYSF